VVVASRDKKSPDPEANLVAIKKIEKAFEHKVFTKRTLRELKILRLLKHENVWTFAIFFFNKLFFVDYRIKHVITAKIQRRF